MALSDGQLRPPSLTLVLGCIDAWPVLDPAPGMKAAVERDVLELARRAGAMSASLHTLAAGDFALILPGLALDRAVDLVAQMQRVIGRRTVKEKSSGETVARLTLSFGVAERRAAETSDAWARRAGACLAQARTNPASLIADRSITSIKPLARGSVFKRSLCQAPRAPGRRVGGVYHDR